MNQALQIGTLSLSFSVLLALVAIALGGFVAHRLARATGTEVEPTLTYMLLGGIATRPRKRGKSSGVFPRLR